MVMFFADSDTGSKRLKVTVIGNILLQSNLFVDTNIYMFAWTVYPIELK